MALSTSPNSPSLREPSPFRVESSTDSGLKTISPKEAMLDYKPEENEARLFPRSPAYAPQHIQQDQNFVTLDMSMNGLPLERSHKLHSSRRSDRMLDFPTHFAFIESSESEAPPSSGGSMTKTAETEKPDSSASTGTYSCTYEGCIHRFSTLQKLQKHKRDEHRTESSITPGIGSGMSTAQLMERNSQTGPHQCDKINPTTGMPCMTIFSRPYDLTRHEDVINNIGKQKARCALCQRNKTFSRRDALTRHMRVIHPNVDFPGKHGRRGGSD